MTNQFEAVELISPTGRLVQGSTTFGSLKNKQGKPYVDKDGNPQPRYFMAVAIDKQTTDPDLGNFFNILQTTAAQHWPQGESQRADFSWKWSDGDDPKNAGKVGFAGCWILKFSSTSRAPTCWKRNETSGAMESMDPSLVKKGHFIRILGSTKSNYPAEIPGMYVNLNLVEWRAFGKEIASGPDGSSFDKHQAHKQLPPGANTAPIGGAPMQQPMQQPVQQPMQQPVQQPVQQPMQQPMQQQPMQQQPMQQAQQQVQPGQVVPDYNFINGQQ